MNSFVCVFFFFACLQALNCQSVDRAIFMKRSGKQFQVVWEARCGNTRPSMRDSSDNESLKKTAATGSDAASFLCSCAPWCPWRCLPDSQMLISRFFLFFWFEIFFFILSVPLVIIQNILSSKKSHRGVLMLVSHQGVQGVHSLCDRFRVCGCACARACACAYADRGACRS